MSAVGKHLTQHRQCSIFASQEAREQDGSEGLCIGGVPLWHGRADWHGCVVCVCMMEVELSLCAVLLCSSACGSAGAVCRSGAFLHLPPWCDPTPWGGLKVSGWVWVTEPPPLGAGVGGHGLSKRAGGWDAPKWALDDFEILGWVSWWLGSGGGVIFKIKKSGWVVFAWEKCH